MMKVTGGQRAVINSVDQNQVWLDVAIPETMPVAGQSVVDSDSARCPLPWS